MTPTEHLAADAAILRKGRMQDLIQRICAAKDDHTTVLDFCCFVGALSSLAEKEMMPTDVVLDALDRATAHKREMKV